EAARTDIHQDQVIVRATGDEPKTIAPHALGQRRGVAYDLLLVGLEGGLKRLVETDGLGGNHVHQWSALAAGENAGIEFLRVFRLTKDQTAARATKRLVRRRGDEVRMGNGTGMEPGDDKPGDVGDVGEEKGADVARDLTQTFEIDDPRIGTRADGDHARPMLLSHGRDLIVVDPLILLADAVVDD